MGGVEWVEPILVDCSSDSSVSRQRMASIVACSVATSEREIFKRGV